MIVGITGTLGAGKGNLVKALQEAEFNHFSVRGFLTKQLEAAGKPLDRDHMVDLANELRAKHNPSYIAEQLFEQAKNSGGNSVIESLRTPGEVQVLRDQSEFFLIAVDGPIEDRYQRVTTGRKSSTDDVSFEEFRAQEQREMTSTDPTKQNIGKCMSMADYFFWSNFETADEARKEFISGDSGFLGLFASPIRRPTVPEVLMREAYQWGDRSTCLSRHTGAVIVDPKGDNLISQGYNGAARGRKHCKEVGCIRKELKIPSGEQLDKCRGVHAEVNAVLNAGRSGRSVIGMTMYATNYPCKDCANTLANSGIGKVVHLDTYNSRLSDEILEKMDVQRYGHGVHPDSYPRFWKGKR